MNHKHPSHPLTQKQQEARIERLLLVKRLSHLLWDETKPEGEEGIPEDRWEAILTAPCNGDKQLIADVCEHERTVRSGQGVPTLVLQFTSAQYPSFVRSFFNEPRIPVQLLWDESRDDWHPEERWYEIMSGFDVAGLPNWQKHTANLARLLRDAKSKGVYKINL